MTYNSRRLNKTNIKLISLILSFCLVNYTFSQIKTGFNQSELCLKIKIDATKMSNAFLKADYITFAKFTYPRVLQTIGGVNNMVATLSKTTATMQAQGISFIDIKFGYPSAIVNSGEELQCTLLQHTEIKTPNRVIIITSTLIAISTDKGNNWTFVDTSNKDIATLRKVLPNLSNSIVIPPTQPPIRSSF
jgi:hypothetical protein